METPELLNDLRTIIMRVRVGECKQQRSQQREHISNKGAS